MLDEQYTVRIESRDASGAQWVDERVIWESDSYTAVAIATAQSRLRWKQIIRVGVEKNVDVE